MGFRRTRLWLGTAAALFALALAIGSIQPPAARAFRSAPQGASATRPQAAPAEAVRRASAELAVSEKNDTEGRGSADQAIPEPRRVRRRLPPGCAHADELMVRFAVSFGADNVIWLDRAQTRAYWQAYNELPPPTMYGSDNMIAVRGRFAIPILDGVGCRVWPVRPGGEHERALDQVLNGGPEL